MPSAASLERGPLFSWHRTHDGLVYTSGHAAVGVDDLVLSPGEFAHEARVTLENLERTLTRAGTDLARVIRTTVYLTDMANYAALNQIYREFFGDTPPARTCVEVRRLPYNFKIEIDAIAHL